jgi:hypothetical protein
MSKSSELLMNAGLTVCYAIVIVGAGHGMGPVGAIMILGMHSWILPGLLSWVGVALLVCAVGLNRLRCIVSCIALVSLAIGWSVFVLSTESLSFTLITSVPLFCAITLRIFLLIKFP